MFITAAIVVIAYFAMSSVASELGASSPASIVTGILGGAFTLAVIAARNRRLIRQRCPEGKGLYPECLFRVSISDTELTVVTPAGESSSISLGTLQEVAILTNDSGPTGADVWWSFVGPPPTPAVAFPQGATGEPAVLEALRRFPRFDYEAMIRAMGSTSNARFVCWRAGA